MSEYLTEKLKRYQKKLKKAQKHGEDDDAAKYAAKCQAIEAQMAAEGDDPDSDSTTDDDEASDDEVEDRSFVLEEEPDLAPTGMKGASKLVPRRRPEERLASTRVEGGVS